MREWPSQRFLWFLLHFIQHFFPDCQSGKHQPLEKFKIAVAAAAGLASTNQVDVYSIQTISERHSDYYTTVVFVKLIWPGSTSGSVTIEALKVQLSAQLPNLRVLSVQNQNVQLSTGVPQVQPQQGSSKVPILIVLFATVVPVSILFGGCCFCYQYYRYRRNQQVGGSSLPAINAQLIQLVDMEAELESSKSPPRKSPADLCFPGQSHPHALETAGLEPDFGLGMDEHEVDKLPHALEDNRNFPPSSALEKQEV